MSKTVNVKKVNTILDMQLSLWGDDANHYIKVIYFGGKRVVYRVGSPEWEKVARDMNVWSLLEKVQRGLNEKLYNSGVSLVQQHGWMRRYPNL